MKVALADIQAGMVLLEPAVNHQGQVLLPKGAVIAEKHLRIFKTWGVRAIEAEGEDDAGPAVDADEETARLTTRFRRVKDDPVQKSIMAALIKRLGGSES